LPDHLRWKISRGGRKKRGIGGGRAEFIFLVLYKNSTKGREGRDGEGKKAEEVQKRAERGKERAKGAREGQRAGKGRRTV
jgi:hypothetical protein